MLNALHQQGITADMWKLYDSMYTNIQSSAKWMDELSGPFTEGQGIRQGGNSSADNYKAGKNKILSHLDEWPSNWIGNFSAGAVMVADDLAVAAKNPLDLQCALNTAALNATNAISLTYRSQTSQSSIADNPTNCFSKASQWIHQKKNHISASSEIPRAPIVIQYRTGYNQPEESYTA